MRSPVNHRVSQDNPTTVTATFVLRFQRKRTAGEARWRGSIEHVQSGEALLKEGINAWHARGWAHLTPFLLSLQAEAGLKSQKLNDGTEAVIAAQAIVKGGCDLYWEAELYRLQGELLRAQGTDDERAERCFRLGLDTARQQGARMLELRAAVSLAHLWKAQNQSRAARQVLAETCDQFSEGFDTLDLLETGDLLLELAQQPDHRRFQDVAPRE